MRDKFTTHPIQPIYLQSAPNEPLHFGKYKARLCTKSKSEDVEISAELHFLPKKRLHLIMEEPGEFMDGMYRVFFEDEGPLRFDFEGFSTSVEAFMMSSKDFIHTYTPRREPVQLRVTSPEIQSAVFHLLNWPEFHGTDDYVISDGQSMHLGGRIRWEVGGWSIVIAETNATKSQVEALKNLGGHALTHVGEIRRADGALFSTTDLDEFLQFLHYLFAFAMGRWSGPHLVVGLNEDGDRVFEQWGVGSQPEDAWNGSFSIFDNRHAELISNLASGFWALWISDLWNKALQDTIYWYVGANSIGRGGVNVDSALLLSQPALELLSWNYLVREREILSPKVVGPRASMNAANRFRVLASTLGIPLKVPAHFKALRDECGDDAMEELTNLRNKLVHPTEERDPLSTDVYTQAWKLSLWYIEMCILSLCKYQGEYSNRLAKRMAGQVEFVPWVSSAGGK